MTETGGEHAREACDELRAAGNAAYRAADWAAAERLYTEAWAASGGRDCLALCNRCAVRLRRGDGAGATADAREAVRVAPYYAKAHYRLAQALERAGCWREALSAVRECARLVRETGAVPPDVAALRRSLERAWVQHHYGPATAALGGRVVVRMCDDTQGDTQGNSDSDNNSNSTEDANDRGKGVFVAETIATATATATTTTTTATTKTKTKTESGNDQAKETKQQQAPKQQQQAQPVKRGETIFTETPLVSHMEAGCDAAVRARTCAHCLRSVLTGALAQALLDAPAPGRALCAQLTALLTRVAADPPPPLCCCPHCGTAYCSPACRDAAWTAYHCMLCPGETSKTSSTTKDSSDSEEAASADATETKQAMAEYEALADRLGLTNPLCIARMAAGVAATVLRDGTLLSTALEPYSAFEWNPWPVAEETRFCALLRRAMCGSAFYRAARAVANKAEVVDAVTSRETFRMLHGVLQRNASRVQPVSDVHMYLCSVLPVARVAPLLSADWAVALAPGGTALFRVANTVNHSCVPNCQFASTTNDHRLAVIATRDIAPGAELLVSYIDESRPYADRQKELLERYCFHCACPKCQARQ